MKAMKVKASLRNYRMSAQKVREVANIVRGVMVSEAEVILSGVKKDSGNDILKLVKSAAANAENNFKLNKKDLFISEIKVDEGAVLKRWRARAHGTAARILKRSCHINIVVEAIVPKEKAVVEKAEVKKDSKKPIAKKENKKTVEKVEKKEKEVVKNSK